MGKGFWACSSCELSKRCFRGLITSLQITQDCSCNLLPIIKEKAYIVCKPTCSSRSFSSVPQFLDLFCLKEKVHSSSLLQRAFSSFFTIPRQLVYSFPWRTRLQHAAWAWLQEQQERKRGEWGGWFKSEEQEGKIYVPSFFATFPDSHLFSLLKKVEYIA